ncbi:MerR family transcriptional regulator [Sulfitobacter sp. F26169L]|uniref:MerR family transcriptional regulator n=1 Tax=Sulfitobacter sp. F26169L TaxID=2996015 RepID=UPI002260D036|nr:MerR family transcriptional regulator [Sulfitobacter sp. F26169L]
MSKSPDAFRTISEVADWLGIQAHVLRFWESKFTQVKPIKRAGGRRYYRPADMLLLGGIKKLLHDDGLTIKGVQKLLREEGMSHVAAMSTPLEDADIDPVAAGTPATAPKPEPKVEPEAVVLPFEAPRDAKPQDIASEVAAVDTTVKDEPTLAGEPELTETENTHSADTPGNVEEAVSKSAGATSSATDESSDLGIAPQTDEPTQVEEVALEVTEAVTADALESEAVSNEPESMSVTEEPSAADAVTQTDEPTAEETHTAEAAGNKGEAVERNPDKTSAIEEMASTDGPVQTGESSEPKPVPSEQTEPETADLSDGTDADVADEAGEISAADDIPVAENADTVNAKAEAPKTTTGSARESVTASAEQVDAQTPVDAEPSDTETVADTAPEPDQPVLAEGSENSDESEDIRKGLFADQTREAPANKADEAGEGEPAIEAMSPLPSFLRNSTQDIATPASSEVSPDKTEPVQSPQPEEAPEPEVHAPKARDIGMPDVSAEADIHATPAALTSACRTRRLDRTTAEKMRPLLAQLGVLRDQMAARRSNQQPKS